MSGIIRNVVVAKNASITKYVYENYVMSGEKMLLIVIGKEGKKRMECSKKDWKLLKRKIAGWQKNV